MAPELMSEEKAANIKKVETQEQDKDHAPGTVADLGGLASLQQRIGNRAVQRVLAQRAGDGSFDLDEATAGRIKAMRGGGRALDSNVAKSLGGLAGFYRTMGDYAKAERLRLDASAILRKTHGETHPLVAANLHDLARLYHSMGDHAKAEATYKQALEMRTKLLGQAHPDVAATMTGLAALYAAMGQQGKADPLHARALAIDRTAHAGKRPGPATTLTDLAEHYRTVGEYGKAELLYAKALEIFEKKHGGEHPLVTKARGDLARVRAHMVGIRKAKPIPPEE